MGHTGSVERNDMIADLYVVDALTNALYDTSTLVSENDGEGSLWVLS